MRYSTLAIVAAAAVAVGPATASATMPLRNSAEIGAFQARYGLSRTGEMDSATQACAWQRDCPPLPSSSASSSGASSSGDPAICHNGILADDAGQGCADGLYDRIHGSSTHAAPAPTTQSASSAPAASPNYSGGSSNSMVNPACESGGNSQVVDSTGTYWGKYQFDRRTWIASGGSAGSYGSAGEAEQDRVAANVHYDAWPNC